MFEMSSKQFSHYYNPRTQKYTFPVFDLLVYINGKEIKISPFRHRHNADKHARDVYGRTVEWHVLSGMCTSSFPPNYID